MSTTIVTAGPLTEAALRVAPPARRRRVHPDSRVRPTGAGAPELRAAVRSTRSCRVPAASSGAGEWHLTARGVGVVTVATLTTFVLAVVAMVSRFLVVSG